MLFFLMHSIFSTVTLNLKLTPYSNKTIDFNQLCEFSGGCSNAVVLDDLNRPILVGLLKANNIPSAGVSELNTATPPVLVERVLLQDGTTSNYDLTTNPTDFIFCACFSDATCGVNPTAACDTRYRFVVSPYYNKKFTFDENCTFCACQGNCPIVNAGPTDMRNMEFSELLIRNAVVEAGVLDNTGDQKVLASDYTESPYNSQTDILDYVICGQFSDIPCSKVAEPVGEDVGVPDSLAEAFEKFSNSVCQKI